MPELAPAGGGQVQLVEVSGKVASLVDWDAVARRPPDLVWRPQHQRRAVEAAAHARDIVARVLLVTWQESEMKFTQALHKT